MIFQTERFHGKKWREKVDCYRAICHGYPELLAFELGRMFAPNGDIFNDATIRGLMDIPELIGLKHCRWIERKSWRD